MTDRVGRRRTGALILGGLAITAALTAGAVLGPTAATIGAAPADSMPVVVTPAAVPATTSTSVPGAPTTTAAVRAEDLPRGAVPADEARAKAREVLARREYDRAKPNIFERLWVRVLEWLAERIGPGTVETVAGFGPVALAILVVLVGLVVFLIVRQLRLGGIRRKARKAKGEVVLGEGGRPAQQWLAEAEEYERKGEFRSAVRCQWRALVADAAGLGLVVDDSGRTTGDHRRDLPAAVPSVRVPFGTATDLFEHAWYSLHPIVHGDLQRMKQWAAEVRAQYPSGPVARFDEPPEVGTADGGAPAGVAVGAPGDGAAPGAGAAAEGERES